MCTFMEAASFLNILEYNMILLFPIYNLWFWIILYPWCNGLHSSHFYWILRFIPFWPFCPSAIFPTSPSIPYFSLCCLEFFFHGGRSFNYSQPFHWLFLSVTVFRWIWLSLPLQPSLSWTSLTAMWGSCPLQPCIKSVAPCGEGCFAVQHPDLSGLPLIHTQVFLLQQFSDALSPSVHLPLCLFHRPPLYLNILTPLQSGCRLYDPDHSLPNPLISYISLMSCTSPSNWTSLGGGKSHSHIVEAHFKVMTINLKRTQRWPGRPIPFLWYIHFPTPLFHTFSSHCSSSSALHAPYLTVRINIIRCLPPHFLSMNPQAYQCLYPDTWPLLLLLWEKWTSPFPTTAPASALDPLPSQGYDSHSNTLHLLHHHVFLPWGPSHCCRSTFTIACLEKLSLQRLWTGNS